MHNLENSIRLGLTAPVYLFYGEETLLMEQAVEKLAALVAPAGDSWNRETLRGDECEPADVLESAQSCGFFAGKKLVVVRNISWFKQKRKKGAEADGAEEEGGKQLDALIAYAKDPNPATVLVLMVNGNVSKASRIYKAVQAAGRCVEFTSPRGGERELWLKNYLHAAGKQAAPQVCQYVCLLVADGLTALKAEADKLILYCADRTEISMADAEAIVSRTSLAGSFELTDSVAAHDAAAAVATLRRLYRQGEAAKMVLGMLASQYHNILAAKDMAARGFRAQEIASALGIAPYYAKKCVAQARGYENRALLKALDILLAADYDSMRGKGNIDDMVELAVLRICAL